MSHHERHLQRKMYKQQVYLQHAQHAWMSAHQWLPGQLGGLGGSPDLRIGDTERTAVTEALQQHYAEGRLDTDELEERLDATLAAKTMADLKKIMHDLPGPHTWEQTAFMPSRPPREHNPHRHGRFFKAPLAIFLLLILPVSLIFHMPGLIFIAFRILLVLWLGALAFSFVRRRFRR